MKKKVLIIAITAALLAVIAAACLLLLPDAPAGKPAESSSPEEIYWNVDRDTYIEQETGLSLREPAEDGSYHIRFGRAGGLRDHPELLFVLAIAVHKFPEGMAGGVGLGADAPGGLMVAIGVALQNLPEGMVMIPPLLGAGMGRGRAALIALLTGLLNALGVLAGAAWGMLAVWFLPLALAFAGGAMLDVIVGCMIPGISGENVLPGGRWILMGGFLLMTGVNMLF